MFNIDKHNAMEITLRKYGNSTVAVLPPALLKELHLAAGQSMTLGATEDGKIVLSKKRKYTLDHLIAQCDQSAPEPTDIKLWNDAKPVGNEVW